jgi:hypothetical protein
MANVIEFSLKAVDNFSAEMGTLSKQMSDLEKTLGKLAIAGLVYKAVDMAKASLENADAMGKAAQKAGTTAEEFSALAWAAKLSEVETGTLSAGLRGLSKAMVEGEGGAGGLQLAELGIDARKANGELKQTTDVLMEVADAFANAKDDAAKTTAAMAIFSRAGREMVPMLNEGSKGLKDMMKDAEKLGMVISGDFAASADKINDNLTTLSNVMKGRVNVAMAELAPTLELLTNQFVEFSTEGDKVQKAGHLIADVVKALIAAGKIAAGVFEVIGTNIGGMMAVIVQALSGDFKGAAETFKNLQKDMYKTVEDTTKGVADLYNGQAESVAAAEAKKVAALRKTQKEMETDNEEKKKAREELKKLEKDLEAFEIQMQTQIQTMGMSSSAAKLYELAVKGLGREALDTAINLNAQLEASTKLQESQDKGADIIKGLRTPQEEYNLQMSETVRIMKEGEFSNTQITEALGRQAEAWAIAKISTQDYKDGVTDAFASAGETMAVHLEQMGSASFQMGQMIESVAMTMVKGVGDSIAAVIVDGADLSNALANVAKQVMKTVISTLIQIGIQRMILAAVGRGVDTLEGASKLGTTSSLVYATAFLDSASLGPIGLAAAPAVAAASVATMLAGATVSKGTGAAVGSTPAAHGGLDYVPSETTYLLDKGERVLSPRQNTDLTSFLDNQGGGSGMVIQNLTIHVLENATNVDAFTRMDKIELRNTLGQPVVDALNEMFGIGVRPDFAMQGR